MVQILHRWHYLSQLLVNPRNRRFKFCYHPCTIHLALAATMKFVSLISTACVPALHQLEAVLNNISLMLIGLQETKFTTICSPSKRW